MALFVRPDSPPPRQPSPDILPAPLPYPRHPRRIASQPKIRVHSPSPDVPPGLHAHTKTLNVARSYDVLLAEKSSRFSDDGHSSLRSARERVRATVTPTFTIPSVSSTPSSSRPPSMKSSSEFTPHHRRTTSVVFPNASPPFSPSSAQNDRSLSVPEVPYRYTGPRHIICPQPVLTAPIIILPDIDQPRSDVRFPPMTLPEKPIQLPPLERHKSMGVACLKFFGIRSSSRRPRNNRVVAV